MISRLFPQLRTITPICIRLYIPVFAVLALLFLIRWQTGISIAYLTRDPAQVAQISPLIGLLSNLGILLWCATVSICFFSFILLSNCHYRVKNPHYFLLFFLYSGMFTLMFLIDDLFMIHEIDYPGVQQGVYLVYTVALFCYLFKFRKIILRTDWLLFALAFVFFGASVTIDLLPYSILDNYIMGDRFFLVEDGLKLLGIVSWCGYLIRVCFQSVINVNQGTRI